MRWSAPDIATRPLLQAGIFFELILPVMSLDRYWLAGISCTLILVASITAGKPKSILIEHRLTRYFFIFVSLNALAAGATALSSGKDHSYQGLIFSIAHYKVFLLVFACSLLLTISASTTAIAKTLELVFWACFMLVYLKLWGSNSEPISRQIGAAEMMFFIVPNDSIYLVILGASAIALSKHFERRLLLIPVVSALMSIHFESRLALLLSALSCVALLLKMRNDFAPRTHQISFAALSLPILWLLLESNLGQKIGSTTLWNERLALWWAGATVWPGMLGEGVGSYFLIYEEAKNGGQIPTFLSLDTRPIFWAHNILVEAFCERGVMGLALIATLFGMVVTNIVTRCSKISSWDHFWPLCMFIIGCSIEMSLYNHTTLLLLALFIFMASLPHQRGAEARLTRDPFLPRFS